MLIHAQIAILVMFEIQIVLNVKHVLIAMNAQLIQINQRPVPNVESILFKYQLIQNQFNANLAKTQRLEDLLDVYNVSIKSTKKIYGH